MVKLAIAKENWHSPLPVLGPAIAAWPGIVVVTAPASIHAGHDKLSWKSARSRPHSSSVRSPLSAPVGSFIQDAAKPK